MATQTPKPTVLDGYEIREMTEAEYAQWHSDKAEAQARIEVELNKVAARQAVLDKLGLTANEAQALLG